ncbi:MAG: transglutaminaseTgpA domain-containing protein [Solirubrobacteraceae bacterium]
MQRIHAGAPLGGYRLGAPRGVSAGGITAGAGSGQMNADVSARSGRRNAGARAGERGALVRLGAFAALGLYGVLRWATLLSHPPIWRLIGLLGLALVLAGAVAVLAARHRAAALLCCAGAVLAVFPLAGVPLAWVLHARIAVTANEVGYGLSALPGVLVPYLGEVEAIRIVIVLGAGVLLLDAAMLSGFAPKGRGDGLRAVAALPLVALAVVPCTLARPELPYLQGAVLFGLLIAFVWGQRIARDGLPAALALAGLAAVVALVAARALDPHRPWLDYRTLAGTGSSTAVDTFDWSQRYGPLRWPRSGREVLEVRARRPEYWKTEDLDVFDGRGWIAGGSEPTVPLQRADPGARARWTQTLRVTIRAMRSTDVIAAGLASRPAGVSGPVGPGSSPGTWRTGAPLAPGNTYLVRTYASHPTPVQLEALAPSQLAAAAREQPEQLQFYRSIPVGRAHYARALMLAHRLAGSASTPYAYVVSVEHYLAHGFSYDEQPPPSRYPLESFLFKHRRGYCQQFAGAMALLLRMGGVPARVAVGFTTGSYDQAGQRWLVSDIDAHAWVEAWFPRYGWVRFDPTPAGAPARGGLTGPALDSVGAQPGVPRARPARRPEATSTARLAPARAHKASAPAPALLVAALGVGALLAVLAFARTRRRGPGGVEPLLTELERALPRGGEAIEPGVTLAALEHRLRASPQAAAYVRTIRLARFGAGGELPSFAQRRALRRRLRLGRGPIGALRVWWALPPRIPRRAHVGLRPLARKSLRALLK